MVVSLLRPMCICKYIQGAFFLKKGGGLIPHSSIWIRLRVTDVDKQNCRNQLGWVVGWNVVVTPCMVGCIELSGDRFVGEADVSAGEFLENG